MIIEHDGKRIDTDREIRFRLCQTPVIFVGRLRNGGLIFEWGDNCWEVFSPNGTVSMFENVPQKHEAWVNVYPDLSDCRAHETKQDADRVAGPYRIACCRIEWES